VRVWAGLVVLTVLGALGGVVVTGEELPPVNRPHPEAVRLS